MPPQKYGFFPNCKTSAKNHFNSSTIGQWSECITWGRMPTSAMRSFKLSVTCKINIDSDSRLAMTAAVRKVFHDKPGEFDPRKYLGPARDEMKKLYIHKIVNVLGSDGKAE